MKGFRSPGVLQRVVSKQSATRSRFRPGPPPLRPRHPLPSARSFRGVEIRGECRLINDYHTTLQTRRVNVTTPFSPHRTLQPQVLNI